MCVVYSSPLHFLTPPAPLGSLCFLSKGDPHSLGVGENGNKTLRMRAADFFIVRIVLLFRDVSKLDRLRAARMR